MEQEIQDIIAKNLPEQVGKVLKERLEKAENDASYLKAYQSVNETLNKENSELKKKAQQLDRLMERIDLIEEAEKMVAKETIKSELRIAEIRLEEANKRADELKEIVSIVFKSPVYRKAYMNSVYHAHENGSYNPKLTATEGITETEE